MRKKGRQIDDLVKYYKDNHELVRRFLGQIEGYIIESPELKPLIHSIRSRTKDPEHLRGKLQRKGLTAKIANRKVMITTSNLFQVVTDLAGCRVLHLYQSQFFDIDVIVKRIVREERLSLIEGPVAKTWDDETRTLFTGKGVQVASEPSMYTSVHYILGSASETMVTCELQIRTLIEETWGELSHSINYPTKSPDPFCDGELRVLARIGSSAVRMIECIQERNSHARRRLKTKKYAKRLH
jgi:putative GTP pyrophosphokinase